MADTHYLIVGASHAALSALHAIRMADPQRPVTVVSKDDALPYSPTVLPYVVSGRSDPSKIFLRDGDYFERHQVNFVRGRSVARIDAAAKRARLSDGSDIGYEKLLVASGAAPVRPPIPGLDQVRYHVLRSLDDALALREALPRVRQAVVLGGGLIGMHAAENLAKAKARVTVIERESQVLPAYFDAEAGSLIENAFVAGGVEVRTNTAVARVSPAPGGCALGFADGSALACDLLLVGTGVTPVTDFLQGSGVATDRGVLVDDRMRASVEGVWAAGDVAQARGFYGEGKVLNGILPDAVEQGRIAGMGMADDPALKDYPGGVPLNTYTFFGNQALSVGAHPAGEGYEVVKRFEPESRRYLKMVLREDRLVGIFGVNRLFDPGVMWELILRRVDLGPVKTRFLADPQAAARELMSRIWR